MPRRPIKLLTHPGVMRWVIAEYDGLAAKCALGTMGPGVACADAAGVKATAVGKRSRSAGATARYAVACLVAIITLEDVAGVGVFPAVFRTARGGVRIATASDRVATGVFEDPAERDIGALQGHVHTGFDDVATVILEFPTEPVWARLIEVATVSDEVATGVVLRATVAGVAWNHRTAIPDRVATGIELVTTGAVFAWDWVTAGLGVTVPIFTQSRTFRSATRRLSHDRPGPGLRAPAARLRTLPSRTPVSDRAVHGILGSLNTESMLATMRDASSVGPALSIGAASAVDGGSAAVRLLPTAKLGADGRDTGTRPFGVLRMLLQVPGQRLLRDRNLNVLAGVGIVVTDGNLFLRTRFGQGGTGSRGQYRCAPADQSPQDRAA